MMDLPERRKSPSGPSVPIRWWPALAISIVTAAWLGWMWRGEAPNEQARVMATSQVLVVASFLLLIWLFFLSRLRPKVKLAFFAGFLGLGVAASRLVTIRGVSGNLVPILEWRAGDRLGGEAAVGVGGETLETEFDFPQFLGPSRDTRYDAVRLDPDWASRPPREVWRREIGEGWAAFAVLGDAAVTQEQRGDQEMITRYDLETGELVWSHGEPLRYESVIGGNGPRATPTLAGGRVYAMGAKGLLTSLDLATGEVLWKRDVLADSGGGLPDWGKSCSPLVEGGKVIVSGGGSGGKSLLAYDADTGEVLWHSGSDPSGYSSPVLMDLAGMPQVLIFNQASIVSHHPEDGRILWSEPWPALQPNVAVPLKIDGERVLVSSGYGIGSRLLRLEGPGEEGGSFQVEPVWESTRMKAKFTNLALHEGFVYGLDDGILVCLDPETGERRWKRGRYGHGQVILVGDLLLIQAESGQVALVEASPEQYRELGSLPALGSKTWNPPALAGKYLLVRNDKEAVCYELPLLEAAAPAEAPPPAPAAAG